MASRDLRFNLIGVDKSASKSLDKVGGKADKTSAKFAGMAKAGAVGAALAGGAFAAKFGVDSVRAFEESQESARALQDAFDRFPALADSSAAALGDLNSALALKTKYDDDATASGQAVLAQFGLTGKQLESLTPLLQDYAAKTGKDMPTAAEDLGKAVLGQGKALKAIGLEFKDTGSAAGNLAQLQEGLSKQVGGFAAKEGKSASGQAAILKNQYGELQELVGSKLVPVMQKVTEKILGVVAGFKNGTGAGGKLREAFDKVRQSVERNRPQLQQLLSAFSAVAGFIIGKVVPVLLSLYVEHFARIVRGVSFMVDAFGRLRTFVNSALVVIIGAFVNFVGVLVNGAAKAFGWIPGIGPKLKKAATEFNAFRDKTNAALNAIKNKSITITANTSQAEAALDRLNRRFTNIGGVPVAVGGRAASPRLGGPQRALGGPVRAGAAYTVGERGPETFVPASAGVVRKNGGSSLRGGDVYNITVTGLGSARDIAETVRRELVAMKQRGTRIGLA